jgi:hypothetical protein
MNEMKGILLPGEPEIVDAPLQKSAMLMFAPLDKRAFGAAVGAAAAIAIIAITAVHMLKNPAPSLDLDLLAQYFPGYSISWPGALIGGAWAFASGFCAGWFTAFVRNLVLAVSLFVLRSKAELADSRDFLDHI